MWGTYENALLPGTHVIEGGQTSTGSSIAWLRRLLSGGEGGGASPASPVPYSVLNEEAAAVPPGSEGLIFLDQ